jgi:hypothetical protein
MKVEQLKYYNKIFETLEKSETLSGKGAILVLAFGAKKLLEKENIYGKLKEMYPSADIVLSSTSGEIYDDAVFDDTVSITAVELEQTNIKPFQLNIKNFSDSYESGKHLFNLLPQEDLSYVLIISDGNLVNGSELVRGCNSVNIKKFLLPVA